MNKPATTYKIYTGEDREKATRELPAALLAWRMHNNLTQLQAATILHLTMQTTYSKWERGLGCHIPGLVIDFTKMWQILKDMGIDIASL